MPLYARTEKRLKRKEREDELGITAIKSAMKENGELGDSDSEDGGSVSGESSDEDEDVEDDEVEDEEEDDEDEASADDEEVEDEEEDGVADESASDAGSEAFPLSIEDIETNPIYPLEGHEGCLLCPGKLLKHAQMRDTHLSSAPHKRAMKRWQARLAEIETRPLPSDDPRDVMNEILDDLEDRRNAPAEKPTPTTTTNPEKAVEAKSAPGAPEGKKKKTRRGRTKSERKDQKAKEALASVTAEPTIPIKTAAKEASETKEGGGSKRLNRRARRLLVKQAAGDTEGANEGKKTKTNGKAKSDKTNGGESKADKSSKTKELVSKEAVTTADGETPVDAGKEKKRRKRNSEAKAQAP